MVVSCNEQSNKKMLNLDPDPMASKSSRDEDGTGIPKESKPYIDSLYLNLNI